MTKRYGNPTITLRMPRALVEMIDDCAGEAGRSEFVRRACWAEFDGEEPNRPDLAELGTECLDRMRAFIEAADRPDRRKARKPRAMVEGDI